MERIEGYVTTSVWAMFVGAGAYAIGAGQEAEMSELLTVMFASGAIGFVIDFGIDLLEDRWYKRQEGK